MAIWMLTPLDTTAEPWRLSWYKGTTIVRAASAAEARRHAYVRFSFTTPVGESGSTLYNPWGYQELVSCQQLEQSRYTEDGPSAVLFPPKED